MKVRKCSTKDLKKKKKVAVGSTGLFAIVGPEDVICGRGKPKICHIGNRRMRRIVQTKKIAYKEAGKSAKTMLIQRTIDEIISSDGGGEVRFLKQAEGEKPGIYRLATRVEIWDKISHCLREKKECAYDLSAESKVTVIKSKALTVRKAGRPRKQSILQEIVTATGTPKSDRTQSEVPSAPLPYSNSSDEDTFALDSIHLDSLLVSQEDLTEKDFCLIDDWSDEVDLRSFKWTF